MVSKEQCETRRLNLFGRLLAAAPHADPRIVRGFDLLLVGQNLEIQAALLVVLLPKIIQFGTSEDP